MTVSDRLGSPARPDLLRQLNERTVLDTIFERAPISRAEIARIAGISKPTVSLALRALLEAGLVRETESGTDGPTYGAIFFDADPDAAAVIAVDIGARYVRAALADVTGAVRAREDVETGESFEAGVLAMMPALTRRLFGAAGLRRERLACAIVGVPGVVEPGSGRVRMAENVAGLEGQPIGAMLSRKLGVPAQVLNDVNLAALGERDRGAGRGVESFVFVSVGTGLGAGLVLGGELVSGSHGAAGEIDLMRPADSRDDPSAPAIREYAASRQRRRRGPPVLDTVEIFARAREGERWALAIVEEVARRVRAHRVPICAAVDPALIVLGGGIGSNGDLLLGHLESMLAAALPFPPAVVTSELRGEAVLAGALALGVPRARDWSFATRE
jgi:predicted NBD/HSP70 family sugar kinase